MPLTANVQLDPGTPVPLQGALELYNTNTTDSAREPVSDAGKIEFYPIAPGTYEVTLNTSGGGFIKSLAATGGRVTGRMLEIKGTGPVQLTVTIARGEAQINGVALKSDKPMAGAMIVLVPTDPAHNHALFRRDQSDSDGSFTLRSVVPGTYTLLALENGWDLEWLKPAVLKPYLPGGKILEVQPNGSYDVKVNVQ